MLGENHSLINEFPSLSTKIEALNKSDELFKAKAAQYDALDAEIRSLELQNSPADDATMHELKQQRAKLKDDLYQCLLRVD
ncbi:YdcH family protein [Glaciecola sp. MH2013]|uniref:YdcH family protein n=1 Tax=Glaciecola sp. MH2013 TaxID=2785524 RepID=UPI00189DE3F1|nr:YdcH family protein [Glaciecola sp. MH2013]MBF7073541.1 YdcH family protein [Glaciecola sp. MH2013]